MKEWTIRIASASLVTLLAAGLAGCGKGDGGSPAPAAPTTPSVPVAAPPTPTEETLEFSSSDVPKDIPNLTTITSSLNVPANGTVLDVSASVGIQHTWRGDLEIRLRHPDGTEVAIFTPANNDSRDDVDETFTTASAPSLRGLLNRPSVGTWTLLVVDGQPADKGRLHAWSLRLRIRR